MPHLLKIDAPQHSIGAPGGVATAAAHAFDLAGAIGVATNPLCWADLFASNGVIHQITPGLVAAHPRRDYFCGAA
jgi:hypothetical protein